MLMGDSSVSRAKKQQNNPNRKIYERRKMKIKQVMTKKVINVNKNDDLRYVLDLMEKYDITKIPVMDNHRLVGIVTDNKIADKLGSIRSKGIPAARMHASSVIDKNFNPVVPDDDVETLLKTVGEPGLTMLPVIEKDELVGVITKADLLPLINSKKKIQEIMNEEIHTVSPGDRVVHARRILLDNDIARIPVVNEGQVVGIVSDREIAFAFAKIKKSFSLGQQHYHIRELLVKDVMKKNVVTLPEDATIKDAADLMIKQDIGCIPIIDNKDKIKGMVTRTDLLKML